MEGGELEALPLQLINRKATIDALRRIVQGELIQVSDDEHGRKQGDDDE
jgi:hypothetical protein